MAGNKKREPKGIDMLWNYNALIMFIFLFLLFATDFTLLFGELVRHLPSKLLHLIYFVCFMTILFSLTYKKHWAYHFIVFCYGFWLANTFISLLRINSIENHMAKAFYAGISPLFLLFLFLNSVVLWYVYEKHQYITKQKGKHDLVDKVFRRVMLLFYVSMFFFLGFIIIQNVSLMPAYKTLDEHLKYKSPAELADYCTSLDTQAKEICEVYTVSNYGEMPDKGIECSDIESELKRYNCYRLSDHG